MGWSGDNGGQGKEPHVRAAAGTGGGDGSGLLGAAALGVRAMDGSGQAQTRARLLVRRQGMVRGSRQGTWAWALDGSRQGGSGGWGGGGGGGGGGEK